MTDAQSWGWFLKRPWHVKKKNLACSRGLCVNCFTCPSGEGIERHSCHLSFIETLPSLATEGGFNAVAVSRFCELIRGNLECPSVEGINSDDVFCLFHFKRVVCGKCREHTTSMPQSSVCLGSPTSPSVVPLE